jgi:hypothetical protein
MSECTWEPLPNLRDVLPLIEDFEKILRKNKLKKS